MLAVGGTFKALSAVAFFFAWKFYKLPCAAQAETVDRQDSSPSVVTIMDGPTGNGIPKENADTELVPVAQFITVSDSSSEEPKREYARTTNL